MATVIRTSLRTILTRIKDKLLAELIPGGAEDPIPGERVIISIRKKVPHLQADSDIIIKPRGLKVRKEVTDMAGRWDTRIERRIEVRCRSRLALDDPASDETFLLDETLGHITLEELVCDCLQEALLTENDDSDNLILCCPMLLEDGQDTAPDTEASRGADWGETSLFFNLQYMLRFSESP